MTRKQSEVLDFIKEYIGSHGYSPTYQEIAGAKGLTSLATVHKHVHCLVAEGRIALERNMKQSIRVVSIPAATGRFEFEGAHHLWDRKLKCYWVKEEARSDR